MSIVWYAWQNFKWIGRLKSSDIELTDEQRQQRQMQYIMRIVFSLVTLAMLPFIFTFIVK